MSRLREFFKRRSENLQKQKRKEVSSLSREDKPVLTDEIFWDIINRYIKETRENPHVEKTEILSAILAEYPEEIILAFGKRFEELNK